MLWLCSGYGLALRGVSGNPAGQRLSNLVCNTQVWWRDLVGTDSVVQVPALPVPQLGSCTSSGRAWWPRAAQHSQGRGPSQWGPNHGLRCSSEPPLKSPISLLLSLQARRPDGSRASAWASSTVVRSVRLCGRGGAARSRSSRWCCRTHHSRPLFYGIARFCDESKKRHASVVTCCGGTRCLQVPSLAQSAKL